MTRFGLTQKALVNHQARRKRLFPAESDDRLAESRQGRESLARDLPQNRLNQERRASVRLFPYYDFFFGDNGWGLLIVPALFFIQRRNGEVAEWSKALPC